MPADRPLERISLTIPPDVLRRADRIAKREGRSRSWVLTDAVRRLPEPTPAGLPRLDESRRAMLEADLALSPTERVLAAERTAREVPVRRFSSLFVTFERFEDYLEWKRRESMGG
jgi:predicted transcriptional regulator